jgi:hypothetical protein
VVHESLRRIAGRQVQLARPVRGLCLSEEIVELAEDGEGLVQYAPHPTVTVNPQPPRPSPPADNQEFVFEGDVQVHRSEESYDCTGYGNVAMQVAVSGSRIAGTFRSGTLTNDAGCTVRAVSGDWSGTIDSGITVDDCTVNGEAYDSSSAFDDQGELDLECSTVGNSGVLYELDLQVHQTG